MLEIDEFDAVTERYTGRAFKYAKDSSDHITGGMNNATNIFVTGDMTHVSGDRYIVIERDDFQSPPTSAAPRVAIGFPNVINTPRAIRFNVWGVVNDPDCVANPVGGPDIHPDPTATGVVGMRKFPTPGGGATMYGVSCASCHAGFARRSSVWEPCRLCRRVTAGGCTARTPAPVVPR